MDIDAQTRLVGLLGYPIEHSRSPLIHNTAFRHQGLNWLYVATPVVPGEAAAAVQGLKALHFAGANVTIPHKEAVRPLMDELSPQAQAVGAVNTIVCRRTDGEVSLFGDNTDVAGFLEALRPYAEGLQGAALLLFGAGGAARAVAYALLSTFRPSRLTIVARRPAKAEPLVRDLVAHDEDGALEVCAFEEAAAAVRASTLLVNATPVGMHPHTGQTPWPHPQDFSSGQIAYDLIYNPEKTRFLEEAAARGVVAIGGLEMLIQQAAASYSQWTGRSMPTEVVRRALAQK